MEGFAIVDSQMVLLKFLDGYLNNSPDPASFSLAPFIISTLRKLANDLLAEGKLRDSRDALTFQSIVLLLLCLTSIGLADAEGRRVIVPCVDVVVCEAASLSVFGNRS